MNRYLLCLVIALILASGPLSHRVLAQTPPPPEGEPAAQCAEGERLYLDGQGTKALPLLEAGFAERENATFTDPDDLGRCALALGILRADPEASLEAYAVAVEIFRSSGNQKFEAIVLTNIGNLYIEHGLYADALDSLQQAATIFNRV